MENYFLDNNNFIVIKHTRGKQKKILLQLNSSVKQLNSLFTFPQFSRQAKEDIIT
jgi:hypothetical protein